MTDLAESSLFLVMEPGLWPWAMFFPQSSVFPGDLSVPDLIMNLTRREMSCRSRMSVMVVV